MRFRAVTAWLTLSAYLLALIGAYALHAPHIGVCHSGQCCTLGHCAGPDCSGHDEHKSECADHDHDSSSDRHPPGAPARDGDDCVWCQFLALAAWQGPAVAEIPLAVPVGTLCVLPPEYRSSGAPTLHLARGPPAALFAVAC